MWVEWGRSCEGTGLGKRVSRVWDAAVQGGEQQGWESGEASWGEETGSQRQA